MKLLKKISILIMIAIIIQGSMLVFLDKYYFEVDANVAVPTVVEKIEKSVVIKVSTNSKEFKISYDGMFLSFLDENQLNVVNTVLGTIEKVKVEDNSTISFYKWLPDNNKIIYAQKGSSTNGFLIKFFYYNANNNSSEEVRGGSTNNSIVIEDSSSNSRVSDILLSNIANVMYIKLTSTSSGQSLIYKSENMNSIKRTQLPTSLIGNVQLTPGEGMLYYEDLYVKKLKNVIGNSIDIPEVERPTILGVDSANNIYIGDVLKSKVTKIYWGVLNGNSSSFNSKVLKASTDMKNIYITLQGKIYINDGLKGVVTELNSGLETAYTGLFKCIYDKGIVSIDEEKVVKTPF